MPALLPTGPQHRNPRSARVKLRPCPVGVRGGGALLFIADHQPFPAAAAALAREFGFLFYNGYVLNPSLEANQGWITFTRAAGTLHPHPIVSARGAAIDSVTLFMGQAFLAPPEARPLLELDRSHYLFLPGPDRKIGNGTPRITVERWLQGATLEWGGRTPGRVCRGRRLHRAEL